MSSHNTSSGRRNDNHNNRSGPSSKSRSKSLSRRGSSGQSSLSTHIQQQMERPRRKGRDPTPLSRSRNAHTSLNYRQPLPSQPSTSLSPPRRTIVNQPMNNIESSPSSSQERAAIAANLAKNSFSAHQNLQKLIDEQWERERHRMEHAQKMQGHQPQNQQVADLELAQSIAEIMTFHRRNSAPGTPSHRIQIDSYEHNNVAQQQQQQRRSKSQPMMDRINKYNSFEIKNEEFCSLQSNFTAPTTALSLSSESLSPTSEPSNTASSFRTLPRSKQPQRRRQNSSTQRYLKEHLYYHLQDAPRESRVHLTRHIENLQSENHRLNEVNLTQVNQIDNLESEIVGLMRELTRYRLEFGDTKTAARGGESVGEHVIASPDRPRRVTHTNTTAVESIFDANATSGQRSLKAGKMEATQATVRLRGVSAISNQQLLLMLQQQEQQEEYYQDEISRGTRSRSNSLEDKFEHQRDGSCFVEQKGGKASSTVPCSVSVPSMTNTDGPCSWSYSSPKNVIER